MGLRGAKMGSKRPIKSFKVPKTCICKNLEKPSVFNGFWGAKAVQDSLERPKKVVLVVLIRPIKTIQKAV